MGPGALDPVGEPPEQDPEFCEANESLKQSGHYTNAVTAGIIIKSRAISDSIWRQSGATVWTKLIPAGNLVSTHH